MDKSKLPQPFLDKIDIDKRIAAARSTPVVGLELYKKLYWKQVAIRDKCKHHISQALKP